MVAGARGDEAAVELLGRERRDLVVGAADLVGARALHVLGFEEHAVAGRLAEVFRVPGQEVITLASSGSGGLEAAFLACVPKGSKVLAINESEQALAIVPTHFTVATEDYPLSRRLYFTCQPSRPIRWPSS